MGKLGLFMSDINHNIPIYVRVSPPGQTEKKRGGGKKKEKKVQTQDVYLDTATAAARAAKPRPTGVCGVGVCTHWYAMEMIKFATTAGGNFPTLIRYSTAKFFFFFFFTVHGQKHTGPACFLSLSEGEDNQSSIPYGGLLASKVHNCNYVQTIVIICIYL